MLLIFIFLFYFSFLKVMSERYSYLNYNGRLGGVVNEKNIRSIVVNGSVGEDRPILLLLFCIILNKSCSMI